jgi:hypothetical protein
MAYALFVKGKRETEWYPSRTQAVLEAYSKGFVQDYRGQHMLKESIDLIDSGREELLGK